MAFILVTYVCLKRLTRHTSELKCRLSLGYVGILQHLFMQQVSIHYASPSQLGLQKTLTAPLQRSKIPPSNKCHRYDAKQSDGEVLIMLELWGMWNTPSLSSLSGPLWPGVVAPDRVLSMSQIELNCVLMLN